MSGRVTRSQTRKESRAGSRDEMVEASTADIDAPLVLATSRQPLTLPQHLTRGKTRLSQDEFDLLQLKQNRLQLSTAQVPLFINQMANSGSRQGGSLSQGAAATLVFAQAEAGTAVCIAPCGLLLTCAHCVTETESESGTVHYRWLLFASGQVVKAKCIVLDFRRDLALLQIVAAQATSPEHPLAVADHRISGLFPFARIAGRAASNKAPMVCVGHPGSEDLEASTSGIETHYDVLHISQGEYRGVAAGQDLQDNSEIGALQHTAWTYWGHSGAPLLLEKTGELIGLHSSWDDETGMRRGVPLQAIRAFLTEYDLVSSGDHSNVRE